jgi:cell division protein FtsB
VPPSASSAGPRFRGRFWVLLWLVVFLLVAIAIQARQSSAIAIARRLTALHEQRGALEAERAALERQIHLATSRRVLGARAEAELGLHQPADSQFFTFRLGGARP